MKKKKKWIRRRHLAVMHILYALLAPFCKLKYGIKIEKIPKKERRQSLILYNHQTPFDQFFVGMAFHPPLYFLASEDIFSNGFVSSLIRFLVAPIPIKKQTSDIKAVMNCIRVAKEGGSIAIAPEGNRTYSGKTEYISPSITTLAKKLGLPIAIFRLEGGYGVQPRWSDVVRRGKMRGYFSRIIEQEEYRDLSNEEFHDLICRELYVNEATTSGTFTHKRAAEYLERAIYVCPDCGLARHESEGDLIRCSLCGKTARYLPTKELCGVGCDFPFRYVNDWYEYQSDFVRRLSLDDFGDDPLFSDKVDIYSVIVNKKKRRLAEGAKMSLYKDRITFTRGDGTKTSLPFDEIKAMSVLGRNKLNIYHGADVFQIKGGKRYNAIKYMNIFYSQKSLTLGGSNGKFLGL